MNFEEVIDEFINNNGDWCCKCGAGPIHLNVEGDHKHFDDHYRKFDQLLRCCNCQRTYIFKYKLVEVRE